MSSKALPIVLAAVLIGGALTPIYLANRAVPGERMAADGHSGAASNLQKISYAMGYYSSQQVPPEVDIRQFAQGIEDARAQKPLRYSEEELTQAAMDYQQEAMQQMQEQVAQQQAASQNNNAQDSGQEGAAFLAENAKKPGIMTTASGLQYQVIKQGDGKKPAVNSEVTVHYEGKLIDGTVFDSSKDAGPLAFMVNRVIPGWTEGLQLMNEGGEYRFFIPADLAYGKAGAGDKIPPNSTLIFDVQLLKVRP